MHTTAIAMLEDMVNLWRVWHHLPEHALVAKVQNWSNNGYSVSECNDAKAAMLSRISIAG